MMKEHSDWLDLAIVCCYGNKYDLMNVQDNTK